MKILMVSDARSIHTRRWASSLKDRGVEVVLYSINPIPEDDTFYEKAGVELFVYDLFRYKRGSSASLFSKFNAHKEALSYLKRLIKSQKPDILHAHYATSYGLISVMTGFHPFVISVWGSDVYEFPRISRLNELSLRFIFRKADLLLSTSRAMAEKGAEYTSKQFGITPFGVDTGLFSPSGEEEPAMKGKFTVGVVKTLSYKYGIDLTIKAFTLFKKNNPDIDSRLLIAGDGPDNEKLRLLVRDLSMERYISFLGYIPNDRLPELYRSFDTALFLSREESFGVSVVEAISCGVPVIVSATPGFREVVEDGVSGSIVPVEDIEAAATAIGRYAEDTALREKYSLQGRKRAVENYDWVLSLDTMIGFYKQLSAHGE